MASTRRRKSTKITKYEKTIEDLFKNEMGLLVDKVKPGGGGKQNDTNTARNFLEIVENILEILASTKILFADFI